MDKEKLQAIVDLIMPEEVEQDPYYEHYHEGFNECREKLQKNLNKYFLTLN